MDHPEIKVLDHGMVRLVDSMGSDLSVSRSARVSYDAAWRAGEDQGSDARLIRYLWKNKHTTPFESVTFTFEVKAPIFVLRQWMRHRTWAFNELSARYRELPGVFYVPKPEHIGTQAKNNKQGRDYSTCMQDPSWASNLIHMLSRDAHRSYNTLLLHGMPRELARMVLPLNTYSHMFATVNLLNLLKFITLRADAHAQYEIVVYAEALLELIRPIVPVCVQAYEGDKT